MRITRPALAAALPNLTYTLHNNLYVPLTSRSNTVTLPASRGPQFVLPPHVVAALCRFRDVEHDTSQWKHWCLYLDTQDSSQVLPPPFERIANLDGDDDVKTSAKLSSRLLAEINQELSSSSSYDAIVFAGEGEPTLRFQLLLELARQVSIFCLPLRLVTNGLLVSVANYNNHNNINKDDEQQHLQTIKSRTDAAMQQLVAHGISSVTVDLMTANPDQYNAIMQPQLLIPTSSLSSNIGDVVVATGDTATSAHERVCHFIQSAVQSGLNVETTGVDRPDVDKRKAEALALSLGVTNPFRWRSYFP